MNINSIKDTNGCRICFSNDTTALIEPCNCKGSISLVHERCLAQWLRITKKLECEVCQFSFKRKEKVASIKQILINLFKYVLASKQRTVKAAAYIVYLLIFGKRFFQTIHQFGKFILTKVFGVKACSSLLLVNFAYNAIVFGWMIYLMREEADRISKIAAFMQERSKTVQILNKKDIKKDEQAEDDDEIQSLSDEPYDSADFTMDPNDSNLYECSSESDCGDDIDCVKW